MNTRLKWLFALAFIFLFFASFAWTSEIAAQAPQPSAPGEQLVTAPRVAPADARKILAARTLPSSPRTPRTLASSETDATPEIVVLARGLRNDPKLIFDFVHNYIEYVPTYGSVNGATATLLARRGNDWDQTSLFIALMRQAGYTANYKMGDVTYSVSRLANWVGTVNDINVVANVFANGGVPVTNVGGNLQITRVWAEAVIGATTYTFDPAMKEYQDVSGIANLGAALGYNQATFLANAQVGATVTNDYAQSLNETNIRANLATYSANLVNYIRTNLPNADLNQVIGGRRIVATEMSAYATTLPYALGTANLQSFATIGDAYRHTMRVQHAGMDRTFKTFEFVGKRMTIWYDGGSNAPVLRVEGASIITGTATISGTTYPMTITVDHPYAANGGTFADQTRTLNLKSGAQYALLYTFNGASAELIAARNALLARAQAQGVAETSEAVRGETLALIGQMWCYEESLNSHIVARLGKIVPITHHLVGIIGQETGFFVDIPLAVRSDTTSDGVSSWRVVFRARALMTSAFEHSILEQLQGGTAVSTIRMLRESNVNGANNKTFLATSDNWTSGANVRSQLVEYSAGTLNALDWYIANGFRLVLPQDGDITVNSWHGNGYIAYYQSGGTTSMGMIINGGYLGGYDSQKRQVSPPAAQQNASEPPKDQQAQRTQPTSHDPVNMLTGAFTYAHTDLAVGYAPPLGLAFTRYYNSGNHDALGALGYGWSHSYQFNASTRSYGPYGFGVRQPIEAANQIAWAHIALDLLTDDQSSILNWMVTDLATKWAADQLAGNTVLVRLGAKIAEFVKLASGEYAPPPGMATMLTVDGAGYHLTERDGERIEFDTNGRATQWIDRNGNTTTFAYDINGKLTSVTDPFSRAFTFGYTGNLLTSVTDATRNVQFTYASNNLTNFRDARGNDWGYEYDTSNRLTKVKKANPATTALVTNVYDAFDRVQTQTDALGNVTEFFWGLYRNVNRNPDSTEWVAFFDARGLFTMRQDQTGKRMTMTYDGLGRLTQMTDRLGDSMSFTYHNPSGRIASVTNARGNTTTYTYGVRGTNLYDLTRIDYPNSTYEQFTYDSNGNVVGYRDRAGANWTYTVNARGQRTSATNPMSGVTTFTYNADGTLASVDDGDTNPTTFQYDGFRRLNRINYPDGSNNQFVYDNNDNLTQCTDGRGTVFTYAYDVNNNLTSNVRASGTPIQQTYQFQYDAMDRRTRVIDPGSNQTDFAYTYWNALSRITHPGGTHVDFAYNSRQWLSSITDETSQVWQFAYDDEGIVTSNTTPENRVTQYASNKLGNTTAITDPLNKTTTFTRDAMENVTQIVDRLNRTETLGRDNEDRLASITLPVIGAATYTRNGLGLVTRITDQRGNNWDFAYTANGRISQVKDLLNQTWNYAYDTSGRLATITYPDGVVETRTYDGNDNLTRRQFTGGLTLDLTYDQLNRLTATSSVPVALTYDNRDNVTNTAMHGANIGATYDARGRITSLNYAGQMTVNYTYNNRNEVTRVSDTKSGAWVEFSYDKDGLVTQIRRSNGINTDFTRDANGRVTRIQHGARGDVAYVLDAEAQVTQATENLPLDATAYLAPASQTFTYNAANQITSAGFTYDARGRRTADAFGRAYTWDAAGRLTQIVKSDTTTTLDYTALGDVATRTVGGTTTQYLYSYSVGNRPLVAEKRAGAYTRFYVYAPGGMLLYAVNASNQPSFYHYNHIGTTLFLTDGGGNVTDSYAYTPYGQMLAHNGTSDQPFTFVGAYGVRQEGDTDLYQMRARYYDPRTIQFLTRDPLWPILSDPQQINPYAYAAENPLKYVDPTGMHVDRGLLRGEMIPLPDQEGIGPSLKELEAERDQLERDLHSLSIQISECRADIERLKEENRRDTAGQAPIQMLNYSPSVKVLPGDIYMSTVKQARKFGHEPDWSDPENRRLANDPHGARALYDPTYQWERRLVAIGNMHTAIQDLGNRMGVVNMRLQAVKAQIEAKRQFEARRQPRPPEVLPHGPVQVPSWTTGARESTYKLTEMILYRSPKANIGLLFDITHRVGDVDGLP